MECIVIQGNSRRNLKLWFGHSGNTIIPKQKIVDSSGVDKMLGTKFMVISH